MSCRKIDMERYARRAHFAHFSSLAYPYVGLTAEVEVTDLVEQIKKRKLPTFLTVCYLIGRGANAIPELRQRIVEGQIVEYDQCIASHTLALEDGTYCYCNLNTQQPFEDFLYHARKEQEAAKAAQSLTDEGDANELFFFSTLPWMSFTGLVQPTPYPADSNPRITWGRYYEREGKMLLPVSIQCHHALVDGLHISRFYAAVAEEIQKLCQELDTLSSSICSKDKI